MYTEVEGVLILHGQWEKSKYKKTKRPTIKSANNCFCKKHLALEEKILSFQLNMVGHYTFLSYSFIRQWTVTSKSSLPGIFPLSVSIILNPNDS